MAEDKGKFQRKPSKLMSINDISADIDHAVRVMGIVVDSGPGFAVIQDIFDDKNKAKIIVSFEGTLEVKHKYMILGQVTEKKTDDGMELRLNAAIAHNIDELDIALFKDTLEMEERVIRTMTG